MVTNMMCVGIADYFSLDKYKFKHIKYFNEKIMIKSHINLANGASRIGLL